MPPLYVLFHLRNPAATESLDTPEYTRPEDIAAVLRALERHDVPIIMLPSEKLYPLTVNSPSNHAMAFVAYLHANYQLTTIFANGDELWEKSRFYSLKKSQHPTVPPFARGCIFPHLVKAPPQCDTVPSNRSRGRSR